MVARVQRSFLAWLAAEWSFRKSLQFSTSVHVVMFILFVWNPGQLWTRLFGPTEPFEILPAIRVDVVDMPDILAKDLQNIDLTQDKGAPLAPTAQLPTETAKEEDLTFKTNEKLKEKERKQALEKLKEELKRKKAIDDLKKVSEDVKAPPKQDIKPGQVIKGNIVSKGFSLTGEQAEGANIYNGQVTQHMKMRWNLPSWLMDKGLQAVMIIRIGRDGTIKHQEFTKKSGNDDFDRYVLKTVEQSSPLPPPPQELADYFGIVGLGIRFP